MFKLEGRLTNVNCSQSLWPTFHASRTTAVTVSLVYFMKQMQKYSCFIHDMHLHYDIINMNITIGCMTIYTKKTLLWVWLVHCTAALTVLRLAFVLVIPHTACTAPGYSCYSYTCARSKEVNRLFPAASISQQSPSCVIISWASWTGSYCSERALLHFLSRTSCGFGFGFSLFADEFLWKLRWASSWLAFLGQFYSF